MNTNLEYDVYGNHLHNAGFHMGLLTLNAETPATSGERRYYVRFGNPKSKVLVIPAGYSQSAAYKACKLLRDGTLQGVQNTIVVVERTGIGTENRVANLGRMTLQDQAEDFVATVEGLRRTGCIQISQEVIMFAHSLCSYLVGYLVRKLNPKWLCDIVLIAPIPIIPFTMLLSWRFWQAAIPCLPLAVWSIVSGRGATCPPKSARYFFCSSSESTNETDEYLDMLQPDSGVLFAQALVGYGLIWGWDLVIERLRKDGWRGSIRVIACSEDGLMPEYAVKWTAWLLNADYYRIQGVHSWFVVEEGRDKRVQVLRGVLQEAGVVMH